MHFTTLTASVILATTAVSAAPTNEKRQSSNGNFGLSIGAASQNLFDFDTIQTYKLAYANNSAFVGEIKYQQYSEPLVLSGAKVAPDTAGGLSFLSYHSAPTGYQYGYITPGESTPLQFTVPHTGGETPNGASTTGFAFTGRAGALQHNGQNKFFACQSPNEAAIGTYQLWWLGGERPVGTDCLGPVKIVQSDPCSRGN
jgi:hypothetical protein